MYVIRCLIKRLQFYTCFLTMKRSKHTSSTFISIFIIQILHNITTLQFIKNISDNSFLTWPGSVITHGQLISSRLLLSLFLKFWGRSFQQLNFAWYRKNLLAGKEKENSQIFNEDFCLPLYLPLCFIVMHQKNCLCSASEKNYGMS